MRKLSLNESPGKGTRTKSRRGDNQCRERENAASGEVNTACCQRGCRAEAASAFGDQICARLVTLS